MFTYECNTALISMTREEAEDGLEFAVQCLNDEGEQKLEQVQSFFEHDKVLTDVLFYTFPERRFSILVRKEYEADFLGEMFKRKLLGSIRWT